MADDFDAIVVGAGMAGCTAAIRLAQTQKNVLLLERGAEPGGKNLSGGILWGRDLDRVLPGWSEEMPLERPIVRKRFGFLAPDGAASVVHRDPGWSRPPHIAHSVLRARTDAWLAKKAEDAGATVVPAVPVERLLWDGARVRGIVQQGESMTAPVTILCDGANSRLSLRTPIRPTDHLRPEATELGMKEVYRLPSPAIEERFGLGLGEGHAEEWVCGHLPAGVQGGGFLYTNRDTLSVGLIVHLSSLFGTGARAFELVERFKLHPAIAPYLADAELVEYGAKLISSGWGSRPAAFSGDGWMIAGDAAGFVYSNGLVIQGMNYAIRSGLDAAETAVAALGAGDTGAARLSEYDRRLAAAGMLDDFRELARLDPVRTNARFYEEYPRLLASFLGQPGAGGDGEARPASLWDRARAAVRAADVAPADLLRDGFDLLRAF